MNPSTRLETYLQSLRRRIQALILARTAAAAIALLLLATLLGVWWLQSSNYGPTAALVTRVTILAALIAIGVGLLWLPLRRLQAGRGAPEFERRLPDQQGRIQTYIDARERARAGEPSFMIELLAEDAATRAEAKPVRTLISDRNLWGGVGIAAVALIALVGLLVIGPNYWGYASRYLLLGVDLPRDAVPVRRVTVSPGDATVRRNSDLSIRATVEGFDPENTDVFVRLDNEKTWQRVPMQRSEDERRPGQWDFKLFALRGALRYYVVADQTRSPEYSVAVADLPRVNKVRLTYAYPDWTGLDPLVEETVRDIEAVAETKVRIEVFADGPLASPGVMINGKLTALTAKGNANYHIAAQVANETVNLTDDYRIDIIDDQKPTVEIIRPGRDVRATGIEEVPVRVVAKDDFKLREVQLRYSVNGGQWQALNLGAGNKQTNINTLLELERFGNAAVEGKTAQPLSPGDLVSYYAIAKDRKEVVQTDLFMVQVQPYERRFKEGQGGGGGGNGEDQGAISERQREILLATWNLQRSDERNRRSREQLKENADLLADVQKTLAEQARKVAERTRARVSLDEDERIRTFVESMERAAALMDPIVRHLNNFKLQEAVPLEQQALQQLQRAEAAFRDVQVSMSSQDAAQGSQTAQNFTEMFELEMDVEKNQYETQSQASMQNEKQELDEAIRKLKELAERQEKLAQQANRNNMPLAEQRWRQEQLRREAEDLKRRLTELQRQQSGQRSQSQSQQQSAQSGEQSGQPSDQQSQEGSQGGQEQQQEGSQQRQGQGGQQSENQRRLANTTESVKRALDEMRRAGGNNANDPEAAAQSAREASRNLKQALRTIDTPQGGGLPESLEDLKQRAARMARDQRQAESELYEMASAMRQKGGGMSGVDPKKLDELVDTKRNMADEVGELQKEIRDLLNEYRKSSPQAARKLAEALGDLENASLKPRITRSAAQLANAQRSNGRSLREAAASEGIITDAVENLQEGLSEANQLANKEGSGQTKDAGAEQLLAELAELRRSLREAQGGDLDRATAMRGQQQGDQQQGQRGQQDGQQPGQQQGQPGQQQGQPGQQQGQPGQQGDRQAQAQDSREQRGGQSSPGSGNGSEPSRTARTTSPWGSGLGAWDLENRGSFNLGPDIGRLRRDANRITDQINNLTNRFRGQHLSPEDIAALRRLSWELRRLSGDPVADQVKAMSTVLDQIELATLAAVEKTKDAASPRATVQSEDPAAYRETVAEYYRRLGGKSEK
jgi:hypothetical protein